MSTNSLSSPQKPTERCRVWCSPSILATAHSPPHTHTPAISLLLSGHNDSRGAAAPSLFISKSALYRPSSAIINAPPPPPPIWFFRRTGSVFELAAGNSLLLECPREQSCLATPAAAGSCFSSFLAERAWAQSGCGAPPTKELADGVRTPCPSCALLLCAVRKTDFSVLVCQLCCLSLLAVSSTTEWDCLAAAPLLCFCFRRKDGREFHSARTLKPSSISLFFIVITYNACFSLPVSTRWLAFVFYSCTHLLSNTVTIIINTRIMILIMMMMLMIIIMKHKTFLTFDDIWSWKLRGFQNFCLLEIISFQGKKLAFYNRWNQFWQSCKCTVYYGVLLNNASNFIDESWPICCWLTFAELIGQSSKPPEMILLLSVAPLNSQYFY